MLKDGDAFSTSRARYYEEFLLLRPTAVRARSLVSLARSAQS